MKVDSDSADGKPKFACVIGVVFAETMSCLLPSSNLERLLILQAAVYFNKIQCFCFEEQRLLPGEQIDMPVSVNILVHGFFSKGLNYLAMYFFLQVFFYIDPEFETDPRMDGINNIILSYTFFKVQAAE